MKNLVFALIIVFPLVSFSQLDIEINTNIVPLYLSDGDTLSTCRDSVIIFEAVVTDGGIPVTNAHYYWDFDDGNKQNGIDLDSVSHSYNEISDDIFKGGGGFRVKLKVIDETDRIVSTILPVRVAIPPKYKGTKVIMSENQKGICKGSAAELVGKAHPDTWEDDPNYEKVEIPYNYFDDSEPYSSEIVIDEFPVNSIYASSNIDSIAISLIHSDMSNLKITLNCETGGDTVLLKDFSSTNHAVLGDTITDVPYTYYWSAGFSETMNSSTLFSNETGYLPDESFDNLNGCSLNGHWTITIDDNQETDSGYVYSWKIFFKHDLLPPVWTFKDTLLVYKIMDEIPYGTFWSGINIQGETNPFFSGDTIIKSIFAAPEIYNANEYYFHVITNWGCPQDTSILLNVEPVTFTATPESGEAKLDVKFENTTSWAAVREWSFGDKSPNDLLLDTDTVTHKYLEKGTYDAILIITDETGCTDTDTIVVEVSVEPSELDNIPNMFSPDGDNLNDIYKFTEDDLKGMKEFQMFIYNRWGQQVFESRDYEKMISEGWDGRTGVLNTLAAPGIYYYVIKALGKDGNEYKEKGSIHIFR